MVNEVYPTREHGIDPLVTGITADLRQLVREEVTLIRQEIQEDIQNAREAAIAFALGAAAAVLSLILIAFTAVYVLAALAALPLWGCFAIVTTVLVIAAAGLFLLGKRKLESLRARAEPAGASLPSRQARH
jgi:ABC-type uncharacterized transport system fused permease/ATPase subunit